MKKLYALLVGTLSAVAAFAQDPQFTQFYAAPLYHNPAFAGSAHRGRLIANYRNQWPAIPGAFVTYAASADNYWKRYNSGAGLILSADRSGSGHLMSMGIGGQYAYEMPISRTWAFRSGFEVAYRQRSLDYMRLIWRDQLNLGTGNTPTTGDPTSKATHKAQFYDVSLGGLLYSRLFWLGISGQHLNQPNQSIASESATLPVRWSVQTGANIPLSSSKAGSYNNKEIPKSLTPALLYKRQGNFQQFDVGMYMNMQPLVIGAWYRGIPIMRNAANSISQDALAILIGLKMPNWSCGYSYDLTISKLGPGTAGSHELSLSYEFDTNQKGKRKPTAIPCPKF